MKKEEQDARVLWDYLQDLGNPELVLAHLFAHHHQLLKRTVAKTVLLPTMERQVLELGRVSMPWEGRVMSDGRVLWERRALWDDSTLARVTLYVDEEVDVYVRLIPPHAVRRTTHRNVQRARAEADQAYDLSGWVVVEPDSFPEDNTP